MSWQKIILMGKRIINSNPKYIDKKKKFSPKNYFMVNPRPSIAQAQFNQSVHVRLKLKVYFACLFSFKKFFEVNFNS